MAKEKTIILNVETDQAQKNVKDLNKELKNTAKTQETIQGNVWESIKSFQVMGVSINSVIKGLKLLRVSLIATGIGAIAVAVGTLATAFFSTQEGANSLKRVIEPLSEVMGTLWGILQEMGSAMAKILSGDFTGGWEEMGKAVEGFGDKMGTAYERGQKLAELEITLAKNEAAHIKTLGSLTLQREKYRAAVDNETLSQKERQQALTNLESVNEAIFKVTQKRAQDELEILRLRTEANDTDYAAKVEIARKEVEINEAASQREKQRKEEFLIARRLVGGESGDPRDLINPATGLSTNELEEISTEQNVIIGRTSDLVAAYQKQQTRIQNEESNARVRQAEEEAAAKLQMLELGSQALVQASIIAGRETEAGKALAIAAVNINAAVAIIKTWNAYSSIPYIGTALAIAQSVVITAASIAAIKQINDAGKGGQPKAIGTSAPTPQSAAPSFNVVGASDTNQLAQTINERDTQPVKAYVVGSEVSSQQALDRNTVENATVV